MTPSISRVPPQGVAESQLERRSGIEHIRDGENLLALIISASFAEPGIHFFTPRDFSQQLGYMRHAKGKIIEPHVHAPLTREVTLTHEVLVIKRGKIRVDFYDDQQRYLESRVLTAGDVILLAGGGHGFEVLEEIEMLEVKQGPYAGDLDKRRFVGISAQSAKLTR